MSHQTTLTTQISDEHALALACKELGLTLERDAQQRTYNGTRQQALVIKCPKADYDIAVAKGADGKFALSTDWWHGSVAESVGNNYGKLVQAYGVHKATLEARKKGYFVTRTTNAQGQPRLTITGRTL